jgi:hypothetical protein
MKIVPLDREHLEYHRAKVNALKPGSRGAWGTMDVVHMVCHLSTSVALSVDDRNVIDRSLPIIRTIGRWLVFDIFTTWPKGRFKAQAQFTPEPRGSLEEERRALLDAFDRFVAEAEKNPGRMTVSPVLGPITMRYWSHAHGVHLNHHYRQVGLV